MITPYLLRRTKVDVGDELDLPGRTEQVLFCTLTEAQRQLYLTYIHSDEVSRIVQHESQAFAGIDTLRKLCNHPDLAANVGTIPDYAADGAPLPWERSGKMVVLRQVNHTVHELRPFSFAFHISHDLQPEKCTLPWVAAFTAVERRWSPRSPLHTDPADAIDYRSIRRQRRLYVSPNGRQHRREETAAHGGRV